MSVCVVCVYMYVCKLRDLIKVMLYCKHLLDTPHHNQSQSCWSESVIRQMEGISLKQ